MIHRDKNTRMVKIQRERGENWQDCILGGHKCRIGEQDEQNPIILSKVNCDKKKSVTVADRIKVKAGRVRNHHSHAVVGGPSCTPK